MPFSALIADLRYAFRSMRKNAGFTAIAVAALAIGIGANTAIFSLARTVVIAPLPFANPDRLVQFNGIARKTGEVESWVSYRDVFDWRQRSRTFQSIGAYRFALLNLPGGNEPVALYGCRISYNLFPTLGVQPMLGRNFLAREDQPGRAQEVILSHDLWMNRFAADPQILGKTIRLIGRRESEQYVVIGVMPAGFNFPLNIPTSVSPPTRQMAFWIPIGVHPDRPNRGDISVIAIGGLRPGIAIRQARADMSSIASQLEREYPDTNLGRLVQLVPLKDRILGRTKPALLLLLFAISAVVLITCVNIANLLLSRALSRNRETGIRLALGASRGRLLQQWITESLVLSITGGCAGLLIARAGLKLLLRLAPQDMPRLAQTHIDLGVLLFNAGVSVAAGLLFGNLPAWTAAKTDVAKALSDSGTRTTADPTRVKIRDLLVVSEVALAVVLAIGAGLLVKSFARLTSVNPGFSRNDVLTSIIVLPSTRYRDNKSWVEFYRKLLDQLKTTPGVISAGATNGVPLSGNIVGDYVQIDGRPFTERGENRPSAEIFSASPDYLSTMGIRLLRGRYLTEHDSANGDPVAVIDSSAAAKFWPNDDALGKRIGFDSIQRKVVGIVENTRDQSVDEPPLPAMYIPMGQGGPSPQFLAVRTEGSPSKMAVTIRRAVAAIDKDQPVFVVTSMQDLYNNSIADRRFTTFIVTLLGLLATGLAALGVYGVISYSAAQRTREIGIRAALGAKRIQIVKLVLSRGIALTALGIAIGVTAGLLLTRFLASLLYEVTPSDPWTILSVALLLAAISLAAGYLPTYRAIKVDPMTALRHE